MFSLSNSKKRDCASEYTESHHICFVFLAFRTELEQRNKHTALNVE